MKWILTVDKHGGLNIPPDLWQLLREKSGVRSKKRRIIKKRIRAYLIKLVKEMHGKL
jgi:hypothetical protein